MGLSPSVFRSQLATNRDDRDRAAAFDAAYVNFTREEKAYCDRALANLMEIRGVGPHQAKSVLVQLLIFMHLKADERLRWWEHGRHLQSEWEWVFNGRKPVYDDLETVG